MVDRFLLLFPQFRAKARALAAFEAALHSMENANVRLEDDNQKLHDILRDSNAQILTLQGRLDAAQEDRNRLWDLVQDSLRGERTAYQSSLNLQWQRQGLGAPYPDAPQIPTDRLKAPVPDSVIPRPRTGSEQVAAKTAQFFEMYAKKQQ